MKVNKTFALKKNLFEIDNARNLSVDEMVNTFVPTQTFWRLLSAKHQVFLGSRGSGKTALAKMVSHDHLSRLRDERARVIINNQSYFGIYVPTRLEWVSALQNKPWQNEVEKEQLFLWRFNLLTCLNLLCVIESCLKTYIKNPGDKARIEEKICVELAIDWGEKNTIIYELNKLKQYLEDLDYRKMRAISEKRVVGFGNEFLGDCFAMEFLAPLRRGITIVSRHMNIKEDAKWLLCIDEAECLDLIHQRIINTYMRTFPSNNLFIKLITMPYCYYTTKTNIGINLVERDDFDYIYIDSDPVLHERATNEINSIGTQFARRLFQKLAEASGFQHYKSQGNIKGGKGELVLNIRDFLGYSKILDPKDNEWSNNSYNFKLLERYASDKTLERAKKLLGTTEFKENISRKIHGSLLLRDEWEGLKGRTAAEAFSGASMVIRCGDSNPRRIIQIFNALVLTNWNKVSRPGKGNTNLIKLSAKDQSRALIKTSTTVFHRVKSEPAIGPKIYEFIKMLGSYMNYNLMEKPLTTDSISAFDINNDINDLDWNIIKHAVGLGLLYPSTDENNPDIMPIKEGTFYLAYILAPYFYFMPRRGKSHSLHNIKVWYIKPSAKQTANNIEQLRLF
jgi:hypothetical protein